MKRMYDPTDTRWHLLEPGDFVEYQMSTNRYRIGFIEYDGEYFLRNENILRFNAMRVDL